METRILEISSEINKYIIELTAIQPLLKNKNKKEHLNNTILVLCQVRDSLRDFREYKPSQQEWEDFWNDK